MSMKEWMKDRTHIYVLGVTGKKRGELYIKVGIAKDIKNRLSELQTGCPHKINPMAAIQLPLEGAVLKEKEIHRILNKHHHRGEWFLLCDESIQIISDYFLNIMVNCDMSHMVRFENRLGRMGFEIYPDHANYVEEPKVKINNLTGKPQRYQDKKPEFTLFKHAIWRF